MLAKNLRAPRLSCKHALSLTSFASKLAPTVVVLEPATWRYWRVFLAKPGLRHTDLILRWPAHGGRHRHVQRLAGSLRLETAGQEEIYIPYNNYKVASADVKYADLLKVGHLNPQYTRYELHRVWVVEGTLKPTARHLYSKRVLYLNEDS